MQRRRQPRWRTLSRGVVAVAAVALFVTGYLWGNRYQRGSTGPIQINGVMLSPAAKLPEFQLRDVSGQMRDQRLLTGGWSLLAVADLAQESGQQALRRLIEIHNRIADQPALRAQVKLVLLDTGANGDLARQTAAFTSALHILGAATGGASTLRAALGANARGSTTLYVIDPSGALLAIFPEAEPGDAMAEDLKRLAAAPTS